MGEDTIAFVCEDVSDSHFKIVERAALSARRVPKSQRFEDIKSGGYAPRPRALDDEASANSRLHSYGFDAVE